MNGNEKKSHSEVIIEEYHERLSLLHELSERVYGMLCRALKEQGIEIMVIEYRVKGEESLRGKLLRKGDKYHSLKDITDLVGVRVVTYYTDDVDKVAAVAKSLFKVDWSNSVDKRKVHELTSFGYNSLHYVCYLKSVPRSPRGGEICNIPFELQMRTALQHVWSAIEHDIGYKGAVKLPGEYRRQFSRLSGMLELADDEFSRLRTTMTDYRRQVHTLVKSGRLDDVILSTDSFRSFLELRPFRKLNERIAAVNQAEIFPASAMPFLPILESFRLETLGDVQRFVEDNSEDAYNLAVSQLGLTDLDILSETVGLLNLCLVHVLKTGGGRSGLRFVYDIINGESDANEALAERLFEKAKDMGFNH